MEPLAPIPTPPAQRWREFRIQALPVLTFIAVLCCVVLLWRDFVVPTNVIGEVETTRAFVISVVPGTIKEIKVQRFQHVKAGDEIALLNTMDPATLQASLRVIEADLKLMRARMQIDVERNKMSYEAMRLETLSERVELAYDRAQLHYYEGQVARANRELTNQVAFLDGTTLDYWAGLAGSTRTNIIEKEKYLVEKEKALAGLVPSTPADEAILEDIKAQEDQLRSMDQIMTLKAPIDGVITMLDFAPGAKVMQNIPIAVVSGVQANRIIGYVRKPYGTVPKPGDTVQIRRQSFKRETGQGTVLTVAKQLEPISMTLVPPLTGSIQTEVGLPFAVSIPPELALLPGESVDLVLETPR
jgi:multidrug resistance efflux pump